MSVAGIAAAPTATTTRVNAATGGLDQAAFLKLMTAQLTTQDPFKAVDSSQMVAQMAQFSQVAGIAEMNASLASIAAALGAGTAGDPSTWIGRAMLVDGSTLMPLSDGSYRGEIEFGSDVDQLSWSLVDESGQVVHSESAGPQRAGSLPLAWTGDTAGGALRLVVSASADGAPVAPTVRSWTQVNAVQSPGDPATRQLVTPLGLFRPDAARRLG